ncbi:mCG1049944, partial [Mus musculus]
ASTGCSGTEWSGIQNHEVRVTQIQQGYLLQGSYSLQSKVHLGVY